MDLIVAVYEDWGIGCCGTQPVALSAYFIKGSIPHWKLIDIYKGMFQYIGCQVVGIILIIAFPAIVTWLPMYMKQ